MQFLAGGVKLLMLFDVSVSGILNFDQQSQYWSCMPEILKQIEFYVLNVVLDVLGGADETKRGPTCATWYYTS